MAIQQGSARFSGAGSLRANLTPRQLLVPAGFSLASPSVNIPAFAVGAYSFAATALTTASPGIGTPALTSASADTVTLGAPSLRVGIVVPTATLTAAIGVNPNALTTSSPVLGTPSLGLVGPLNVILHANSYAAASPVFAPATIAQTNKLAAALGLTLPSPSLGRPTVSGPGQVETISANSLLVSAPVIGVPEFALLGAPPPPDYAFPPTKVIRGPTYDRHIRRSGDDYAEGFAKLLPRGRAWPRDDETILMRTVRGMTQIWGQVDGRAADLLERESDPRATLELLTDWERNWALPDPCFFGIPQTIGGRQSMLVTKMTLQGAQSREFFIWSAAQLGYKITISEFSPFMVGVSHVGDTRPKDKSLNLITGSFGIFG